MNGQEEIIIPSITPYFLERGVLWFKKNKEKIIKAASSQNWWENNILVLESDQCLNPYELLRKLDDFKYEKNQTVEGQGEFSHRGEIIDIFPVGSNRPFRLEFLGNKIENISGLSIEQLKSEKEIERNLQRRLSEDSMDNLKNGDFLVHLDHGIGIFKEIIQEEKNNKNFPRKSASSKPESAIRASEASVYIIEYAQGDKLYVPFSCKEKLSRYIGFSKPTIYRLGGNMWHKIKKRAKEDVIKTAKELLKIYAQREIVQGYRYPSDDWAQKELEDSFEYEETPDQIKCLLEVKKDMESQKTMDRLICGDVGFGKTEIALRAAFKSVLAGKQAVLIAPTTILANQHWQTFKKRLEKFGINIALMSRLVSGKNIQDILSAIKSKKIDIVIGTHRVLSPDVEFENLGLVIIDEEQKFGVKQKETFKKIRNVAASGAAGFACGVDILSLTATPIPRTLYFALSGLRNISVIETPPPERRPIKTLIKYFSWKIVKEAIQKELSGGGQIYYLHNRIETINLAEKKIKSLLPNIKTAAIHGRLPEKILIKTMSDFRENKIQVLLATTIIENGLDFPNVNTLIVENSARLGLSQAYQLRGRIGRGAKQAFAYFLYRSKNLTEKGKKRLRALKRAEKLGSGYQIALSDLEIRGAGNILGKEQSGTVNQVGLNLYCQMLNEAMEKLRKEN